jgi:hypothetical protein
MARRASRGADRGSGPRWMNFAITELMAKAGDWDTVSRPEGRQ